MDSYRLSATLTAAPVHSSSVPHDESTFYITYSFLPDVGAGDVPRITVYVRQCFRYTAS